MIPWHAVRDSRPDKPAALDATSSPTTVYARRNIRQETRTDPMTDEPYTEWEYEQQEYTREEYALMTSPAIQGVQQTLSALELTLAEL